MRLDIRIPIEGAIIALTSTRFFAVDRRWGTNNDEVDIEQTDQAIGLLVAEPVA